MHREKASVDDGNALPSHVRAPGHGAKKSGGDETCTAVVSSLSVIARVVAALGFLYIFICSLDVLAASFRLLGGKAAGKMFESPLLTNPIVGLVIGILVTVLVQSSSTSTSLIVSLVNANMFSVRQAIPMVMGANVGTSITNTLVSFSQVGDREEFRRAFAAATVHDMFNWMTVLVMLPLEMASGLLYRITLKITEGLEFSQEGGEIELLKVITDPLTKRIVQLDSKVLSAWSVGNASYPNYNATSLLKNCSSSKPCDPETYLFNGTSLSDAEVGGILLASSLVVMSLCLILLVKVLNSILQGPISSAVKNMVNFEMAPPFSWLPGYIAIFVGAGMTFLVQSSSVFTSALTPLAGMGIVTLDRMYPLCLGSNVGTTSTALLAAMASDAKGLQPSLQAALCHMFFNIFGILFYYIIPVLRVPIKLAQALGDTTAKYRWFALVYIIGMFVVFPLVVFGLSLAGEVALLSVIIPVIIVVVGILVINAVRAKKPELLPKPIREDWSILPRPLRSLAWYDEIFSKTRRGGEDELPKSGHVNEGYETLAMGKELLDVDKQHSGRCGSVEERSEIELPNVVVQ